MDYSVNHSQLEAEENAYKAQRISATRQEALGAICAEAHANPALWDWLTVERRSEVRSALSDVVTTPKPEPEGPLDQRFFRTRMSNVEKIKEAAEKLGVSVIVEPLPVDDILWSWPKNGGDYYTISQRKAAALVAAQYAMLTFVSPKHEERLIATAGQEDGQTTFHSLISPSPWTLDMRRSFDFRRCDVCNRSVMRKRAYLVQTRDKIIQVGGECAARMDLTRRLSEMMQALKALKKVVSDLDQEGYGSADPALEPKRAFAAAWALVVRYGFVSRKKANEKNVQSTGDQVAEVLYAKIENMGYLKRKYLQEMRELSMGVMQTDLYDRVLAWAEERAERPESTEMEWNMRSALIAPGPRRLGTLAYAAESARRDLGIITGTNAPPHPYEPESIEEKIALLDDKTAALLGLDDKALDKIRKGKLTKPILNTLTRWLPGIWTIENVREMSSQFGVTMLIVFERDDGSRVKWFTDPDKSYEPPEPENPAQEDEESRDLYHARDRRLKLETQTRWRILSVTDGGVEKERLDMNGKPFPRARIISRAKLVAVGHAPYHPGKR